MRHSFKYSRLFFIFLLSSFGAHVLSEENMQKPLQSGGNPQINFQNLVKDFGDVRTGATLVEDFIFSNEGIGDLIIRSLNPACGCTSAVVDDPVIKPKQKSAIRVTFNTTGFVGVKEKTIRIYSNDPLQSSIVLLVKANILKDITVSPSRLDLGEINQAEGFQRELKINKPTNSPPFTIIEVVSKSSFIKSEMGPSGAGGYVVRVFSEGKIPLGRTKSHIILKTDSPSMPQVIVPINFLTNGEIIASPRAVNFGFIKRSVSSDDALVRIVRIKKASEAVLVKVLSVEKSNRGVDADLGEDTEGQYVRVSINSFASGVVRGVLRLNTDSELEDGKVVDVPYFAFIEAE